MRSSPTTSAIWKILLPSSRFGSSPSSALFDVRPTIVAYDLHPGYLSTKWALEQEEVALVGVQHHHAHVASCLADNETRTVIGVAFDGLGYGTDGALWAVSFS